MKIKLFISKNRSAWLLAIIMAVAVGCSLHMAGTYGLSRHEIWTDFWNFEHLSWPGESNGMLSTFLYKALWLSDEEMTAHGEVFIRLPMIFLALLCLGLTCRLGNELAKSAGSRAPWGLYGSFVLGVNCSFLAFSFHRRFYMLNMAMVLLATWLLLKACQTRTWKSLLWYQLGVWGAISSMLLSSIIVVPHMIYYVISATKRKRAFLRSTVIVLLSLSFFGLLVFKDQQGYVRFNYYDAFEGYSIFLANGYMGHQYVHHDLPAFNEKWAFRNSWCPAIWGLGIISFLALGVVGLSLFRKQSVNSAAPRLLCPLIVGWALLFYTIFTLNIKTISISPNYSWIVPFWCLLLGQALGTKRWVRYLFLLGVLNAIPYTHTSLLVNGMSAKDTLRTVYNHYRACDTILLSFNFIDARYYIADQLGYDVLQDDIPGADASKGLLGWGRPVKIHTSYLTWAMQRELQKQRVHSIRLWLIEDSDALSQVLLTEWIIKQMQAQRLDCVRSYLFPGEIYHITFFPCAAGKPIFKRSAPTPLRGHSALRFLQRCR